MKINLCAEFAVLFTNLSNHCSNRLTVEKITSKLLAGHLGEASRLNVLLDKLTPGSEWHVHAQNLLFSYGPDPLNGEISRFVRIAQFAGALGWNDEI
jgi:hypothetical protein